MLTLGVLSAAGAGAGSFSILIGATAQRLPPSAALRGRLHQCRRLLRPVRVLAAGAADRRPGWVVAMSRWRPPRC
jgi:hypothetical protein